MLSFQRRLALYLVFGFVSYVAAAPANAQEYVIAALDSDSATRINNRGQILLIRGSETWVWEDGVTRRINFSGPWYDLNDRGQFAGGYGVSPRFPAIIDGLNGEARLLSPERGYAYALNEQGMAVGRLDRPTGDVGFFWDGSNITTMDINSVDGRLFSFAELNNAAEPQAVGFLCREACNAFIWSPGGSVRVLDVGAAHGVAEDVNDAGRVVGWASETRLSCLGVSCLRSDHTEGPFYAFAWEDDAAHELPRLARDGSSAAAAVNSAGDVVGFELNATGKPYAMLWHAGGGPVNLNDLLEEDSDWYLKVAYDINDYGQIVGEGIYRGQTQNFLLTPQELVSGTDLVVNQSVVGDHWQVGGNFQLITDVHNRGPNDAHVVLSQSLPSSHISLGPVPAFCAQSSGKLNCDLGVVPVGSRKSVQLHAVAEREGTPIQTIEVASAGGTAWELLPGDNAMRVPLRIVRATSTEDDVPPIFADQQDVVVPDSEQLVLDTGATTAVDGSLFVVGAPSDGQGADGAVYLFQLQGGRWQWIQSVRVMDSSVRDLGVAVAVRDERLLVGYKGGALVFERDVTGSWTQAAKLTALGATVDFGSSVALDKERAVVAGGSSGEIVVFDRSNGGWEATARLSSDSGNKVLAFSGNKLAIWVVGHGLMVWGLEGEQWQLLAEKTLPEGVGGGMGVSFPYMVEAICGKGNLPGQLNTYRYMDGNGWVNVGEPLNMDNCGYTPAMHSPLVATLGPASFFGYFSKLDLFQIGSGGVRAESVILPERLSVEFEPRWWHLALSEDTLIALGDVPRPGRFSGRSAQVHAFRLSRSPRTADVSVLGEQENTDLGLMQRADIVLEAVNLSDTDEATGVELLLAVPAGLVVTSADERCEVEINLVTCRIGTVPARDAAVVFITVEARTPGEAHIEVEARAYEFDPDKENNRTKLTTFISTEAPPRIAITSPSGRDGPLSLWRGQPLSVEFTIDNWPLGEGARHYHWQLDGGPVQEGTALAPIELSNLTAGQHTLRMELALTDHEPTRYVDSVTFELELRTEPTVVYEAIPDPIVQSPAGVVRVYYRLDYAGLAAGAEDFLWTIRTTDGGNVVGEGALTHEKYFEPPTLTPGSYVLSVRYKDAFTAEEAQMRVESASARGPAQVGAGGASGGGGILWLGTLIAVGVLPVFRLSRRLAA